MVARTLSEIAIWYAEPSQVTERPVLLSKLALLELCGWIECELDELVRKAGRGRLNDPDWVEKSVVSTTYGLHYVKHFRPMMTKVVGEIFVRRIELEIEASYPGDLDRLRNRLGALWDLRCKMAHANVGAAVPQQITYQAPSVSVQIHKDIETLFTHFESAMAKVLVAI